MMTRPGTATYTPPGTAVAQQSAKWDAGITSLVDLAAVSTISLTVPVIRAWVNVANGTNEVWHLLASQATTVDGSIQRPTDFNSATNAKVWYRASS